MKNALFTTLAITVLSAIAFAETWTVDDDGEADFNSIQSAIDAASNGDEIFVGPGTYTSSNEAVLEVAKKGLSISSTEGAEVTIIDGEYQNAGVYCHANGVLTLDGFSIQKCTNDKGAGIDCDSGIITILNCEVKNNTASERGGAAYCQGNSVASFSSCIFSNNNANNGGAIGLIDSNVSIDECTFENNTATSSGGAIRAYPESSPYVTNSTFTGNNANIGGAVRMMSVGTLCQFTECLFRGNSATTGGAVASHNSTSMFSNCTFSENSASNTGGGLQCTGDDSESYIDNSYFCQNMPQDVTGCTEESSSNIHLETCPSDCIADLTNDYLVDIADLLILFQDWGSCDGCESDLNGDGSVEVNDIITMIGEWGACS